MKIPYLNLAVKDEKLKDELIKAVDKVLLHGRIILGPEVQEFEKKISEYCAVKITIRVNSETDAFYFALRSLDIGPGDEVITTPSLHCNHHCVADGKNKLVLDYLEADKEHLGFV